MLLKNIRHKETFPTRFALNKRRETIEKINEGRNGNNLVLGYIIKPTGLRITILLDKGRESANLTSH